MLNEYVVICECGRKIRGISELHAQKNLKIHQQSLLHLQILQVSQNSDKGLVLPKNCSPEFVADILAAHPYMINDMRSIGNVRKDKRTLLQ